MEWMSTEASAIAVKERGLADRRRAATASRPRGLIVAGGQAYDWQGRVTGRALWLSRSCSPFVRRGVLDSVFFRCNTQAEVLFLYPPSPRPAETGLLPVGLRVPRSIKSQRRSLPLVSSESRTLPEFYPKKEPVGYETQQALGKTPAASYFPTASRQQYHRPWRT
jgi:hypothetical protein